MHSDRDDRTLRIAVTELIEDPAGHLLGPARHGRMERLWLGQALHARVQAAAAAGDPSYRTEVRLRLEFDHAGWKVLLHGRADGIREDPEGGLVVEEIKSVRPGAADDASRDAAHRLQAATYAWMLARERAVPVRAEVLRVELGTARIARERVRLGFEALEGTLRTRLDACLAGLERQSRVRAQRRCAATRLRFPYRSLRRGQERLIQAVRTALEQREHLLLQASTGMGKTVATLFPALRFALANDQRIYVLTPKNLQQQAAMAALARFDSGEIALAVRLRAKAGMCANAATACHRDYCGFARDLPGKLLRGDLLARIRRRASVIDSQSLFEIAVRGEVCPFELSVAAAREAVVTVCDYNYAFDPVVSLPELSPAADRSKVILVVDEIHNLVDRAREISSPALEGEAIARAERGAALGGARIHREVEALCAELRCVVSETVDDAAGGITAESWSAEHAHPAEHLFALRPRFDATFGDYLEYRLETRSLEPEDPFLELYFALLRFLEVLSDGGDHYAQLAGRVAGEPRLRLLCKDPGRWLGTLLNGCHSVIGLSATLTRAEFHRDLLGLDRERSASLAIPSPFPPEHRRIVIDASVTTRWRARRREAPRIARRIAEFSESVPGHCLVLFPSHAFLAEVAGHMAAVAKMLLLQAKESSAAEREDVLEKLRDPRTPPALLLAVAGGVFAEGVDYPGATLSGVAVVGPCLPAPDLERQLLEEEYQERFDCGFDYAYAIPGMTRVVQGAGRLIRSERDTGVIALLGRRFLREPYRSLLPDAWLGDRTPEDLVGDPAAVARSFYG